MAGGAPSAAATNGRDASPSLRPILKSQGQSGAPAAAQRSRIKSAPAVSLPPSSAAPKPLSLTPNSAIGINSYATPSLNSSAALYRQLQTLQAKVENDDVSVTTIDTTMSARLAASAAVVNVPSDLPRYGEMTPVLDANDIMAHLASGIRRRHRELKFSCQTQFFTLPPSPFPPYNKIGLTPVRTSPKKQVDQSWLYRKTHLGPSAEDLLPVSIPDPVIVLSAVGSSGATGISANVDGATLLPTFTLRVPLDKLFGGGAEDWDERGRLQLAGALDLTR